MNRMKILRPRDTQYGQLWPEPRSRKIQKKQQMNHRENDPTRGYYGQTVVRATAVVDLISPSSLVFFAAFRFPHVLCVRSFDFYE